MGYSCTNYCLPELDLWSNFIATRLKEALYLDYLSTSHPIESPVKSPSEINEIFDAVTYSKGASLIRMLLNYISEDVSINSFKKPFSKINLLIHSRLS
jgi:puromycin-sensitive aminopeptidase